MKPSDASVPTEVVDRDHLSAFLELVFGSETTATEIVFFAEARAPASASIRFDPSVASANGLKL